MNKKVLLLCSILSFLRMSQAVVVLPQYTHESGFTCSAISINDDFLKMADNVKYAESKAVYQERLKKVLELIDSCEAEIDQIKKADIFEKVAEELNSLMGLFAIKDDQLLQDIYLNIQMRAALMGNPTAIYEIFDMSFPVCSRSIVNNFALNGKSMSVEQFFLIIEKINEKYQERSEVIPWGEVLAEL